MKILIVLFGLASLTSCQSGSSGNGGPDGNNAPFNKAEHFFISEQEVKPEQLINLGYACDDSAYSPQIDSRAKVGTHFQMLTEMGSSGSAIDDIHSRIAMEPTQQRSVLDVFEVNAPKHLGYDMVFTEVGKDGNPQKQKLFYDCREIDGKQKCEGSYGSPTQKLSLLLTTPEINLSAFQKFINTANDCTIKGTGEDLHAYIGQGKFEGGTVRAYRIHGEFNYDKTCPDGTTVSGFWMIDGVISKEIIANNPNSCSGTVYGYIYQKEGEKSFMVQTQLEGYHL